MAAEYDGDNFRSWDAYWDAAQLAKVLVFSILGAKIGVFFQLWSQKNPLMVVWVPKWINPIHTVSLGCLMGCKG